MTRGKTGGETKDGLKLQIINNHNNGIKHIFMFYAYSNYVLQLYLFQPHNQNANHKFTSKT